MNFVSKTINARQHPSSSPAPPAPPVAPSLRTEELDYDLPPERIATRPAEPRDSARMLVVWRSDPERIEHRHLRDLPEYLRAGDALVFNTTAVMPARFFGRREGTGGKVEGLFVEEVAANADRTSRAVETRGGRAPSTWRVMLKSGGRLHAGDAIMLLDHAGNESGVRLRLLQQNDGEWLVVVTGAEGSASELLDRLGWTPLPPYILKARGHPAAEDAEADVLDRADREWYQTVFADPQRKQSVAAPTAGLHFTPQLLDRIARQGVQRIDVTLHVGPGTFKPVTTATLAEHRMHSEWFEVGPEAIAALRAVRCAARAGTEVCHKTQVAGVGGRVIAVGTTSVRTLESLPAPLETAQIWGGISGTTDLLIAPPYQFKLVDAMLTNFHLPRSTLLALVAAMLGLDRVKAAYREAIEHGYRFYSYGDAMLILP